MTGKDVVKNGFWLGIIVTAVVMFLNIDPATDSVPNESVAVVSKDIASPTPPPVVSASPMLEEAPVVTLATTVKPTHPTQLKRVASLQGLLDETARKRHTPEHRRTLNETRNSLFDLQQEAEQGFVPDFDGRYQFLEYAVGTLMDTEKKQEFILL